MSQVAVFNGHSHKSIKSLTLNLPLKRLKPKAKLELELDPSIKLGLFTLRPAEGYQLDQFPLPLPTTKTFPIDGKFESNSKCFPVSLDPFATPRLMERRRRNEHNFFSHNLRV